MDLMGIEALYREARHQAQSGASRLSLPRPEISVIDQSKSGVVCGHFVHPNGSGLSLSLRSAGLAFAQRAGLAALERPAQPTSASMPSRKQSRRTAARGSSTRTKARSSPIWTLSDYSRITGSRSAWTMRRVARQRHGERFWRSIKYEEVYLRAYESASEVSISSAATSASATNSALTRRSTAERRARYTSQAAAEGGITWAVTT